MRFIYLFLLLHLVLLHSVGLAAPLPTQDIPAPLKPWIPWALYDEKELDCPYYYNRAVRACQWPSSLQLSLNQNGGEFKQQWQVFSETLVKLPGDTEHWPQEVSDQQGELGELLVQSKDGQPYVKLRAGTHTISGQFTWSKLPKSLSIPAESGLVALILEEKRIEQPRFNERGQLWLVPNELAKTSEDNLDLQVFRKIIDTHPISVVTQIKLRASGKQRNINLAPVLLKDFMVLGIHSPLPARMADKQQLQVQLRPGEWVITVTGRALNNQTSFSLPKSQSPWPSEEVWVYEADAKMRQAQISGATSIDPNQTQLPNEWKHLPSYYMTAAQTLKLEVLHRGAVQTSSNELRLDREMWLDYDGKGYTLRDRLTGNIPQQSRLNVIPALTLGRVKVNGEAQFITRLDKDESVGVEIRHANIDIEAESRYTQNRAYPPTNGWQQDLQTVNTQLHLPIGWRLMFANGTDNSTASWVKRWTLLDIFLVLVIALSVHYLYNWRWGILALLTLTFTWHEANAPQFIWLNLLAVIALLRVLPHSLFKQILHYYRWLSLAMLALILIPYIIDNIRFTLYPQLSNGSYYQADNSYAFAPQAEMMADMAEAEPAPAPQARARSKSAIVSSMSARPASDAKKVDLPRIDPNSMIQTGPGLPNWQSNQVIQLRWAGPVKADENSYLMLMTPNMNRLFTLVGIALLFVLAWRLLSQQTQFNWKITNWLPRYHTLLLGIFLLPLLISMPNISKAADLPNEALLQTLKTRLLAPPECLPECAQIEQMQVALAKNSLHIRLRVHAVMSTAIPLPGSQDTWLAQSIMLNGQAVTAIQRDAAQQLWITVPQGKSDILLTGLLPQRNTIPLPLPLKPHSVRWESIDKAWVLDGVKDNNSPESQLQLTRVATDEQSLSEQEQSILPTFIKIERRLNLGLEWTVETTVKRLSPLDVPLSVSLPLLPNEQPMSEQLSVKAQQIKINLAANQNSASWSSRLDTSEQITLTAANNPHYLESWSIATSPIWHMSSQGIPVNYYQNEGSYQASVWLPWPEETLTLNISRPQGVNGQTVTILSSQVKVNAGARANDVTLGLSVLSSRSTQHNIKLPSNVEIQRISIDGVDQRLQSNNDEVSLSLKPSTQWVELQWRDPEAISSFYRFPSIDLGLPSVNASFNLPLPEERWTLWVSGPDLGPAILFWGEVFALLLLSLILARIKLTPLKAWQWFLLGIGLSQTTVFFMLLVVAWLIALAYRAKLQHPLTPMQFNGIQIALVIFTCIALIVLAGAVANGLLGRPDMQITGNNSSSYALYWYQDRTTALLPQPSWISVPLWVYRLLMLAWALWLALMVLAWLRWGWQAMTVGGLWQKTPPNPAKVTPPAVQPEKETSEQAEKPA